jgi:hypothetical protein
MFNPNLNSPLNRTVFVVLGLMIVGFGALSLQHVGLVYRNWWKGMVFGPFAIAFGVLFIAAMFKLGSKSANKTALSRHSKRPKRRY